MVMIVSTATPVPNSSSILEIYQSTKCKDHGANWLLPEVRSVLCHVDQEINSNKHSAPWNPKAPNSLASFIPSTLQELQNSPSKEEPCRAVMKALYHRYQQQQQNVLPQTKKPE